MKDAPIDKRLPAEIFVSRTESRFYPWRAVRVPRSLTDSIHVGLGTSRAAAIADINNDLELATRRPNVPFTEDSQYED